jgi:hypothetical protein
MTRNRRIRIQEHLLTEETIEPSREEMLEAIRNISERLEQDLVMLPNADESLTFEMISNGANIMRENGGQPTSSQRTYHSEIDREYLAEYMQHPIADGDIQLRGLRADSIIIDDPVDLPILDTYPNGLNLDYSDLLLNSNNEPLQMRYAGNWHHSNLIPQTPAWLTMAIDPIDRPRDTAYVSPQILRELEEQQTIQALEQKEVYEMKDEIKNYPTINVLHDELERAIKQEKIQKLYVQYAEYIEEAKEKTKLVWEQYLINYPGSKGNQTKKFLKSLVYARLANGILFGAFNNKVYNVYMIDNSICFEIEMPDHRNRLLINTRDWTCRKFFHGSEIL